MNENDLQLGDDVIVGRVDPAVVCKICGKKYSAIAGMITHIRYSHKLSSKQYYDKYFKKTNDGVCIQCNEPTDYYSMTVGYNKYCNRSCGYKSDDRKKLYVDTCIKKYGKSSSNQVKSIKEKKKKTSLEKFGTEHPMQSSEIRAKRKTTCIERYGSEHILQTEHGKKKFKTTCMEKFNSDCPFSSDIIKEKIRKTNIIRYGFINPVKNKRIRDKVVRTCLIKFGVDNPAKSPQIQNKMRDTVRSRYGVDHYSQTLEAREKARNNSIDRIIDENGNWCPFIGINEPDFFKFLDKFTIYEITRPSRMYGFFPDGYIEELDLVIEFDEPWHKQPKYMEHDRIKNETYSYHHLNVFRVPQEIWKDDPTLVKAQFLELINKLEQEK